jgi:UDP-N-acetylglucosamine transferase subunit ALG13
VILVITGMDAFPLDRLARAADELHAANTLDDGFFIQLGACRYTPVHAGFERFLSFSDVCDRIRSASAVITHGGAGSTLACLQHGKHPIVVPRRPDLGEAADAHQVQLAQRLARAGMVTPVYEMAELPGAIATARAARVAPLAHEPRAELTAWLGAYWREAVHHGPAR